MTIEILKVIISICKNGSLMEASPEAVTFKYTDNIARDRERVTLNKAGFNVLSTGDSVTIMSPTN